MSLKRSGGRKLRMENKGKFRLCVWMHTYGCACTNYHLPYYQVILDAETLNKAITLQGFQQHIW